MKLNPASLAPCTKSITTFNKAAEHLGPRYTYNKNPFLPDPEYDPGFGTEATSPYMLMRGGKKSRKNGKKGKKGKKSKSQSKTKKGGKKCMRTKTKKGGKKYKGGKKSKKTKKTKRVMMRGGGSSTAHGMPPYGLPQGLVNVGREIKYGIKSLYESAVGGDKPVNPDPSVQPIGASGPSKAIMPGLVDPKAAMRHAEQQVAKL